MRLTVFISDYGKLRQRIPIKTMEENILSVTASLVKYFMLLKTTFFPPVFLGSTVMKHLNSNSKSPR